MEQISVTLSQICGLFSSSLNSSSRKQRHVTSLLLSMKLGQSPLCIYCSALKGCGEIQITQNKQSKSVNGIASCISKARYITAGQIRLCNSHPGLHFQAVESSQG